MRSIEIVQLFGLGCVLLSCVFWLAGAGARFRLFWLFTLRGPDSIPEVPRRQSMLNGFATGVAGAEAVLPDLQWQN